MKNWFYNEKRPRERNINKPRNQGETAIMIPAFVDGNYWVSIVKQENSTGNVLFYYADDMNYPHTMEKMWKLVMEAPCANTFRPHNAEWHVCRVTTYDPLTMECGPRTLLHLTVMAYHTHPSVNMLSPLMHPNSANLCHA
jgi:hypothetical protein